MRHTLHHRHHLALVLLFALLSLLLLIMARPAQGRPGIRAAFFVDYPTAVGTRLDNLPSISGHCGVCHYRFTGGGTRNPYGLAIEAALPGYPNSDAGREAAILSVENADQDGDGVISKTEILDRTVYSNTPTFSGLNNTNVSQVTNVNVNDILNYLVPSLGGDTVPPTVDVTSPNGGEAWTGGIGRSITWTASDNVAVTTVDVSFKDSATNPWRTIAKDLPNTGTYTWFVHNMPTTAARVRVLARDAAGNQGVDSSAADFTIVATPGGIAPTTLRDFEQPGTQPHEGGTFTTSDNCVTCHGGFDPATEPGRNFQGSMMAQSLRDPLFLACLAIAEQDAPSSGDLCLRCHTPMGWMGGRSQPTGGGLMLSSDRDGVACDVCHRMVDPIYKPGISPVEDQGVLGLLTPSHVPTNYAGGQYVADPDPRKRGPFSDTVAPHSVVTSAFHRTADFCGTCHDVSNPVFTKVGDSDYAPGPLDAPPASMDSQQLLPLERTYSEWKNSAYVTGVYAPEFAGNKADGIVSTCQDCHMRDVSGKGCNDPAAATRPDLPLHDLTGGNYWLGPIIGTLFPDETDDAALAAAAARSVQTLQKAAVVGLTYAMEADSFRALVTVTNRTGHKLPTGYPEGRRMWIHLTARDAAGAIVFESGAYDAATGVLSSQPAPRVYEINLGISPSLAAALGTPSGDSFHFTLNDSVYKDNRIPPAGFTNAAFASFGGSPVDHDFPGPGPRYADGQNWDVAGFALPPTAVTITARLYYQTTSKEYVEFLRDQNTTNNAGIDMYNLWASNGRAAPVLMDADSVKLNVTGVPDGGVTTASPRLAVLANPFGSMVAFRLELGKPTPVRLEVFDVQGRRVARREYGTLGGGAHRLTWDGRGTSGGEAGTGIYWATVQAGETRLVRQVVKVK